MRVAGRSALRRQTQIPIPIDDDQWLVWQAEDLRWNALWVNASGENFGCATRFVEAEPQDFFTESTVYSPTDLANSG